MNFIKNVDVVVVGGGITGTAILRELSKYSLKSIRLFPSFCQSFVGIKEVDVFNIFFNTSIAARLTSIKEPNLD